jgi:hypothetical protein
VNALALGIGADRIVTLAEAERPEVQMVGPGQPRLWWDADVVDPELAQLVRFARACEDLGLHADVISDEEGEA